METVLTIFYPDTVLAELHHFSILSRHTVVLRRGRTDICPFSLQPCLCRAGTSTSYLKHCYYGSLNRGYPYKKEANENHCVSCHGEKSKGHCVDVHFNFYYKVITCGRFYTDIGLRKRKFYFNLSFSVLR